MTRLPLGTMPAPRGKAEKTTEADATTSAAIDPHEFQCSGPLRSDGQFFDCRQTGRQSKLENVRRFHLSVHDGVTARGIQRVANLDGPVRHFVDGNASGRQR